MTELTLTRFAYLDQGTFGKLVLPSGIIVYTVERPWLNNLPGVSCIPEGRYNLKRRKFNRGGYWAYVVAPVEGRLHILFHIANWPHEVQGCIGLGFEFRVGEFMVVDSSRAFKRFMKELDKCSGDISLTITSVQAIVTPNSV